MLGAAAGSKTEFVPNPLDDTCRSFLYLKILTVLSLLILGGSISAVIGLWQQKSWAYLLALLYAGIAVTYGIFEMFVPSVIGEFIWARYWKGVMPLLARGVILHGMILYGLLLPSVKAQFQAAKNQS